MHAHTQADVVLLLSSCSFHSVLSRLPANCISQDAFFYSLVYDPQQKTLLADKGEIRVGNKFQADITDLLKEGMLAVLNDGVCLRSRGYFFVACRVICSPSASSLTIGQSRTIHLNMFIIKSLNDL